MRKIWILAATAVMALSTPAQAQAFSTQNGYRAYQVNNAVFEVVPRGRSRTNDYWCAAADFARRGLGAGWRQQIYIVRGYGPSEATGRKTAVQFTLDPQAAGVTPLEGGGIRTGFQPGDSMSIQQANGFCEPGPFRS